MNPDLLSYLSEFAKPERVELFHKIIEQRTRYLTVVLEDIYQSQNASAVLRSCDCFGVQDVHIIENENKFDVNPNVAMGSSKWLTMNKFNREENNTLAAINQLKKDGYRIVATSPHQKSFALPEFDLRAGKTALVFGTELKGISNIVKENADEFLYIPMLGFTESFNISVSVALVLYDLTQKLRNLNIDWQLSEAEKQTLLYQWLKKTIKSAEQIEAHFHKQNR